MYRDIEISEKQIDAGQVKEARIALRETRVKYDVLQGMTDLQRQYTKKMGGKQRICVMYWIL